MAKPIPEQFSFTELLFPFGGVNLSTEFELQPAGTCAIGNNVRAYEPGTQRQRGGARPGLTQYIAQQVSGHNLIQHLNYIVDPNEAALSTSFDPLDGDGDGGIPDPSTNHVVGDLFGPFGIRNPGAADDTTSTRGLGPRYVRTGGSGLAFNRHSVTRQKKPLLLTGYGIYWAWSGNGTLQNWTGHFVLNGHHLTAKTVLSNGPAGAVGMTTNTGFTAGIPGDSPPAGANLVNLGGGVLVTPGNNTIQIVTDNGGNSGAIIVRLFTQDPNTLVWSLADTPASTGWSSSAGIPFTFSFTL